MSRSKKKPFITDQQSGCTKEIKRKANRKVRAANKKACKQSEKDELADGKSYRKTFESWSIRDYSFHCPKMPKAYRK